MHMPSGRLAMRLVETADVELVLVVGIAADLDHVLALRRIVEVGEARVVQLQVGAAELAEARDLLAVGRREVVPEHVEVGIDRLVDGGTAAAVVHHARRRDRQLRHGRRHGVAQERELAAEDRVLERARARRSRSADGVNTTLPPGLWNSTSMSESSLRAPPSW